MIRQRAKVAAVYRPYCGHWTAEDPNLHELDSAQL
jgi:hypothetical protein